MTKKSNLNRLRAKPSRLDLTVPGDAKPSTYLTIVGSHSHKYIQAAQDMAEKVEDIKTMAEVIAAQAEMIATLVVGWDEDEFGEFSTDAVVEILKDEDFFWITQQLEVAVEETARFFTGPAKSSKRVYKPKS